MTPPSNAGGEGREVLAREVLADAMDSCISPHANEIAFLARHSRDLSPNQTTATIIAAMLAFSARENADDRAPALVEAAVAEMRERAAKVAEYGFRCRTCLAVFNGDEGHPEPECALPNWDSLPADEAGEAIRALGTPLQEASNVG